MRPRLASVMQATAFYSAPPRLAVRALPLTPLRNAEYDSRLRPPLPDPNLVYLVGVILCCKRLPQEIRMDPCHCPAVGEVLTPGRDPTSSRQATPLTRRRLVSAMHATALDSASPRPVVRGRPVAPRSAVPSTTRACILHCLVRNLVGVCGGSSPLLRVPPSGDQEGPQGSDQPLETIFLFTFCTRPVVSSSPPQQQLVFCRALFSSSPHRQPPLPKISTLPGLQSTGPRPLENVIAERCYLYRRTRLLRKLPASPQYSACW